VDVTGLVVVVLLLHPLKKAVVASNRTIPRLKTRNNSFLLSIPLSLFI
jgi:hypothetical protein